jgi:hypothetical protein
VTNNNGFWTGCLALLTLSFTIIRNHNKLQQFTLNDCLRLAPFLLSFSFSFESESESYVTTDDQLASLSWNKAPSGAYDQIFITFRQLCVCWCGTLSLTRGRICHLQLLLTLASKVILRSESRGTRDHILLSQIRDFRRLLRLGVLRRKYSTPPPHTLFSFESESESESHCDWLSVCLSVLVSSPHDQILVTVLSLGGRPLWREDGSVVCQSVSSIR